MPTTAAGGKTAITSILFDEKSPPHTCTHVHTQAYYIILLYIILIITKRGYTYNMYYNNIHTHTYTRTHTHAGYILYYNMHIWNLMTVMF